jgi:hypothetical protein
MFRAQATKFEKSADGVHRLTVQVKPVEGNGQSVLHTIDVNGKKPAEVQTAIQKVLSDHVANAETAAVCQQWVDEGNTFEYAAPKAGAAK